MSGARGRVTLVGAGPGAPDLITVRGERALRTADAVLYDELASDLLLSLAPPGAQLMNVGKRGHELPTRSQDEINALLVKLASEGRHVVRLKGGDPYIFGRGGEEASACRAAGIPFQVVPGVSSATGALAYAGLPLTDRRYSASFAVVTGHNDPTRVREAIDWAGLATAVDTLVVLMGMRNLGEITAKLQAGGRDPDTPVAAVMNASLPSQHTVVSTLAEITKAVEVAGIGAPAAIVVGDVVRLRDELQWFEDLPLFGRRILVTRQPEQAGAWCRALEAVGAQAVQLPMICIASIRGTPEIETALRDLAEYELVLLTSGNAARELAARAREAGVGLSGVRGRVIAVGDATAQAALDAGLPVERVRTAGPHAAAMLETLRERGGVEGVRVLLPRAERGREILGRGLREQGARVDEVPVYRTEAAPFDAAELSRDLAGGRLDALTFASPSAVRNFVAALGARGLAAARTLPVAAIGPVTAEACREAGLPPDIQAERPDADALVAALEQHFSSDPVDAGEEGR